MSTPLPSNPDVSIQAVSDRRNWRVFLHTAVVLFKLRIVALLLPVLVVLPFKPALALFLLSGAIIYVGVYTVWLKPRSLLNIVIGGAAGSAAVLSGGAAVGVCGYGRVLEPPVRYVYAVNGLVAAAPSQVGPDQRDRPGATQSSRRCSRPLPRRLPFSVCSQRWLPIKSENAWRQKYERY